MYIDCIVCKIILEFDENPCKLFDEFNEKQIYTEKTRKPNTGKKHENQPACR